jgi:hypothetical protein
MKAILLQHNKHPYAHGLIEIAIWRVPISIDPCQHGYKYRLVYVVDGVRVVGYDNERGKGDHKHFGAIEVAYEFKGVASLLADFWLDVNGRVK